MSGIADHHSRVYLIESSELLEENTASFTTSQMRGGSRGPVHGHGIRHLEDKRPEVQIPKVWRWACSSMWFCLVASYEWIRWDLALSAYSSHRLPGSPSFISYPVDFSFFTSAANWVNWICFSWPSVHSFPFNCFVFIFIQIFISDGWHSSLN